MSWLVWTRARRSVCLPISWRLLQQFVYDTLDIMLLSLFLNHSPSLDSVLCYNHYCCSHRVLDSIVIVIIVYSIMLCLSYWCSNIIIIFVAQTMFYYKYCYCYNCSFSDVMLILLFFLLKIIIVARILFL